MPTGVKYFFKDGTAVYSRQTSQEISDNGSTGGPATPATYTAMTTTPQNFDVTGASVSAGLVSHYLQVIMGVDQTYASGANSALPVPTLVITFDEA